MLASQSRLAAGAQTERPCSPGGQAPRSRAQAGARLCLLWLVSVVLFLLRGDWERRVCVYTRVCMLKRNRDGGQERRGPSQPGFLSSSPLAPWRCPRAGTRGMRKYRSPCWRLALPRVPSLPPPRAPSPPPQSAHREETEGPSSHALATALPRSLISVPRGPALCTRCALSRGDARIFQLVFTQTVAKSVHPVGRTGPVSPERQPGVPGCSLGGPSTPPQAASVPCLLFPASCSFCPTAPRALRDLE